MMRNKGQRGGSGLGKYHNTSVNSDIETHIVSKGSSSVPQKLTKVSILKRYD